MLSGISQQQMQRVTLLLLLIFICENFIRGDDLEPSKVVSFFCAFDERYIKVTLEADKIASCNASINCENSSYVEENSSCSMQNEWYSSGDLSNENLCNVTVLYETIPTNNASNGVICSDYTICSFTGNLGLPMITLNCTTDYVTARRSVNATWQLQSFLPSDIQTSYKNAIPDCGISITCENGYRESNTCKEANKQYGWSFSNIPLAEQSCNVTIKYDYREDFNSTYYSNSTSCSFTEIDITAKIHNYTEYPILGYPYEIQCIVEDVNFSFVNISWTRSDETIVTNSRINITTTVGNNYTSILRFANLTEMDNGLYSCTVKISTNEFSNDSFMLKDLISANVSVTVVNQNVDEMLSLKCDVSIVKGIPSSVYILWIINGINSTIYNGNVTENVTTYTYDYNGNETLNSSDNNTMNLCQVIFDNRIIGNDSVTLNLADPTTSTSTPMPSSETNETPLDATAISLISIAIALMLVVIVIFIGVCIYRTKRNKKAQEVSRDYQLQPIEDSGVSVIGKDYASTCESLSANQKVKEWIKTFDMAEIDEECESVISAATEDMLDYVRGHTTKPVQITDSGVDETEFDSGLSPSKQNNDVSQKAVEDMGYVKYHEINQPDHQNAVTVGSTNINDNHFSAQHAPVNSNSSQSNANLSLVIHGDHNDNINTTADPTNNGSYIDHYIASNDDNKILLPPHSTDETTLIAARNGDYIDHYTESVSQPLSYFANVEEQSYIDRNVTSSNDTNLHSNNENTLKDGSYIDYNATFNSMQPPFDSSIPETTGEGSYIDRYIASNNDNSEPLHTSATSVSAAADGSYIDNDTTFCSADQTLSHSNITPTHDIKDSLLSTESISDYVTESDV